MNEAFLSSTTWSGFVIVVVGCSVDIFHYDVVQQILKVVLICSSLITRDDEHF